MDAARFLSEVSGSPAHDPAGAVEQLYGVGFWLLGIERFADAALAFRTMLRVAPSDERGWLGLGGCHEKIGQFRIALELYGTGTVVAPMSVRCQVARARLLKELDRPADADEALAEAAAIAADLSDDELVRLVKAERRPT